MMCIRFCIQFCVQSVWNGEVNCTSPPILDEARLLCQPIRPKTSSVRDCVTACGKPIGKPRVLRIIGCYGSGTDGRATPRLRSGRPSITTTNATDPERLPMVRDFARAVTWIVERRQGQSRADGSHALPKSRSTEWQNRANKLHRRRVAPAMLLDLTCRNTRAERPFP